jgi:hypothetical protein
MPRPTLCAAVLAAATAVACSRPPVQTTPTPATAKTSAPTNALGYYILGTRVEPVASTPVNTDPGYYILGVRADPLH